MNSGNYRAFADAVLIFHVGFVAFVVFGLLLILSGGVFGWGWVRNAWFRLAHLLAIGLVVIQAWLGIVCPLTVLERYLRKQAGDVTYEGGFIAHWLHKILFFQFEPWVFGLCYTLFGTAVMLSWVKVRPRPFLKGCCRRN